MLLVRTKLGLSPIHGIGLLAAEFIKVGTIIWEYNEIVDRIYTNAEIEVLPELAREIIQTHSWQENEQHLIMPGDNARFINHSFFPTCQTSPGAPVVAIRDINIGEEITENYQEFDKNFSQYENDLK